MRIPALFGRFQALRLTAELDPSRVPQMNEMANNIIVHDEGQRGDRRDAR